MNAWQIIILTVIALILAILMIPPWASEDKEWCSQWSTPEVCNNEYPRCVWGFINDECFNHLNESQE